MLLWCSLRILEPGDLDSISMSLLCSGRSVEDSGETITVFHVETATIMLWVMSAIRQINHYYPLHFLFNFLKNVQNI